MRDRCAPVSTISSGTSWLCPYSGPLLLILLIFYQNGEKKSQVVFNSTFWAPFAAHNPATVQVLS